MKRLQYLQGGVWKKPVNLRRLRKAHSREADFRLRQPQKGAIPDTRSSRRFMAQSRTIFANRRKHNAGEIPHTSKFKPWRIQTAIAFDSKDKAFAFERYLKSGSGREFAKKTFLIYSRPIILLSWLWKCASCLAHKAPDALGQPAKRSFLPHEAGIRPIADSCRQSL